MDDNIPVLPPVEAVRKPRAFQKPQSVAAFTFIEALQYFFGTDPDLIWGPYYQRFRTVRKTRQNWVGFSLGAIWAGIPATSQTRPNSVVRFFNWLTGYDPAPSLTQPMMMPRSSRDKDEQPKFVENWQNEVKIAEDWSPSQIDFEEWFGRTKHPADYDNDFYKTTYEALYSRIVDFCDSWFGRTHLEDWRDKNDDVSPWEVPMTDQFIQYARMVAHEDRGYVNWKDILNDPEHRKWLCVSILAQIIERKIFNQLLFGAGHAYQEELDRHDSRWLLQEGFSRKEGRRQIGRASLAEGLIPENFWEEVDDLAGQTVLIFQPLFMLMCLATGQTANRDGAIFWQEIHSILAMAGYFQICMAVSPSIFHILSATPGARYQWDEEQHADNALYDASKNFHKSHNERWRILAELSSKNENTKLNKITEKLNDSTETALYMPFPPNEQEFRVMDNDRRRGGKVMYAVFPKLTRYQAENVGEYIDIPTRGSHMHYDDLHSGSEGMRITILTRCKVVYYQGLISASTDQDDGVPLEAHLNEIAWDRMAGGIFPYFRHYWAADGSSASTLHWPLWPESLDKFWLYWLLSVVVTQFLQWRFGSTDSSSVYAALLFRPFALLVMDAALYAALRVSDIDFLRGPYLYWKLQGINIAFLFFMKLLGMMRDSRLQPFTLIAGTLIWIDQVLLHKFPDAVVAVSGILRNESPVGIVRRAAQAFAATNSTVSSAASFFAATPAPDAAWLSTASSAVSSASSFFAATPAPDAAWVSAADAASSAVASAAAEASSAAAIL
ncbi:hypothetical protein F5Y10DRAFT_291728 [Nemania abortiva]|nr:hypothetical protein F5Y10DRAFT_291728 [Nemania abortiva]